MCGILCSIHSNGTQYSLPKGFPELKLGQSDVAKYQFWEIRDNSIIDKFIEQDISSNIQPLTSSDRRKIESLELLRELNLKLIKVRNNVKLSREVILSQSNAIKSEIDSLTGSESQTSEIEKDEDDEDDEDEEADSNFSKNLTQLIYKISARGPNYLSFHQIENQNSKIELFSSVLSLRQPFQSQPVHFDRFILQFNGELYNEECLSSNDTAFIKDVILKNGYDQDSILKSLCLLKGEFAFILIDLQSDKVYFGRDSVGKRSLLYSIQNDQVLISSLPITNIPFIDCKNEIMIYDLSSKVVATYTYPSLHSRYNLPPLAYTPLIYDPSVTFPVRLATFREQLQKATLARQEAIFPLDEQESSLAVLFSGGLDCTIIAALACENLVGSNHQKTTNIDLLTVGFDNPRSNQFAGESPDRKLSKKSWFHLARKYNCAKVNLRLVEINVSYEDWLIHRNRVQELMFPCKTEMDLSIAIAFYFASSNLVKSTTLTALEQAAFDVESYEDFLSQESELVSVSKKYRSEAKVLFSGLGADELFAGYSRHESIFSNNLNENSSYDEIKNCYDKLSEELIGDIQIIHQRNLGRDDRVISSWGKELRYPYLDQALISSVINDIEPNLKFSFHFETRTTKKKGTKIAMIPVRKFILRELAAELGLDWIKHELKRAIQFGAKSAKLEIGQSKTRGTDTV